MKTTYVTTNQIRNLGCARKGHFLIFHSLIPSPIFPQFLIIFSLNLVLRGDPEKPWLYATDRDAKGAHAPRGSDAKKKKQSNQPVFGYI